MIELLALSFLCGFVTWRVSSLLHTEDAFEWLRRWIGITNDEEGYPVEYPDTVLGNLFHCFWCLSTVVAAPVIVMVMSVAKVDYAWTLPVWLAAATVAVIIEKQVMRSHSR